MKEISFWIDGESVAVSVEPDETLLYVLRERLGRLAVKEGCGQGECGACTVLLDGEPVPSCLVLAVRVAGRRVLTVEGLGSPEALDPVQEAFVREGAIQCGFCTPGMVLTAHALLRENPRPTESEIRQALAGNLCRCTGYAKIIAAVKAAAGTAEGGEGA